MKKLEVGMTFEVVELKSDGNYINVFTPNGWTIQFSDMFYLSNHKESKISTWGNDFNQKCGTLEMEEVKPVGRLIIKSVK